MKIIVRPNKEQMKHLEALADAGQCGEADILLGFVNMSMAGELGGGVSKELKDSIQNLYALIMKNLTPAETTLKIDPFGEKMDNARELRDMGMSYRQIEERLGISKTTLHKYLSR